MSNSEERIASALLAFFRNGDYSQPSNFNPKDPKYYEFQLEEKAVIVDGNIYGLVLRAKLTFNPKAQNSLYPMFDAAFQVAPYLAPATDIREKEWLECVQDNTLLNRREIQEKIVSALQAGKSGIFAGIAACPDWLTAMAEIDPKMRDIVRSALSSPDTLPIQKPVPPAL